MIKNYSAVFLKEEWVSWGHQFKQIQILIEKLALQNGCFLIRFLVFTSNHHLEPVTGSK